MFVLSLLFASLSSPGAQAAPICAVDADRQVISAPTLDPEAVAERLAPVLFVEGTANLHRRHWDLPMAVDFDGDQVGNDNAEAIRSGDYEDRIVPTLYWSVVETDTHVFATYHSFHAYDWTWHPNLFDYESHENDGENLQVVARKAGPGLDGLVIEMVATQAHRDTKFAPVGDEIRAGSEKLAGPAWIVQAGSVGRAAVYMEKGGHGLWPAGMKADRFASGDRLHLRRGIRLEPGEGPVGAPHATDTEAAYQLRPTFDTFWEPTVAGEILGDGKLMDRTFQYCDPLLGALTLPRHYDSDEVSGPGKTDSGISPFAFDRALTGRDVELGALFFDPARRYAQLFQVPADWSQRYVDNPYAATTTAVLESPARAR